ncbi:MAG: hypothetical protein Q9227_001755 [Pyrenula ochraceoflavens]
MGIWISSFGGPLGSYGWHTQVPNTTTLESSGIALAVQTSKSVICFVRNDSSKSREWEEYLLAHHETTQTVKDRAIALRLGSGSQEASFLTAFCPVNEIPTLIVIKNGRLQDQILPNVSVEELPRRIKDALGTGSGAGPMQHPPSSTLNTTQSDPPQQTAATTAAATAETFSESPVRARHSEQNETSQASSSSQSHTSTEASKPTSSIAPAPPPDSLSNPRAERESWVQTQARRNQAQRTERERILAQIEADKADRRMRNQKQKQSSLASVHEAKKPGNQTKKTDQTRIQVRLFDGSSVRNTFSSSSSVLGEIRPWLDHELTSGEKVSVPPYSIKLINPPQPPRTLDITEEEKPLSDLDLGGSATMVMVPLEGAVDAYDSPGGVTGIVSSAAGGVSSAVGWGSRGVYNSVSRVVGSVLWGMQRATGYGTADESQTTGQGKERDENRASDAANSNIKIRTLADQRQKDDEGKQWYNGNQLNFEPRRDDDNSRKDD